MKVFEDVFVASEALDWLHGFLKGNPNFGADVTRQQALQLCQKFIKNGIITDARGKQYNGMFEDNNHLYRFTDKVRYSPYETSRSLRNEKALAHEIERAKNGGVPNETKHSNAIYKDKTTADFQKLQQEEDRPTADNVYVITRSVKKRQKYNLRSTPFTAEPSRTPLVNKMNVLSSTRTDPTHGLVKSAAKRRRSCREDSDLKEVIMNPAAFVAHNRRSLTDKEVSQVWWNIATTRWVPEFTLVNYFLTEYFYYLLSVKG